MCAFPADPSPIPVVLTARHARLQPSHITALFGAAHDLSRLVPLTGTEEYACLETVTVRTSSGRLPGIRVVGPAVEQTRLELGAGDLDALGLTDPSHAVDGHRTSPGCVLEGPRGTVVLAEGVYPLLAHLYGSAGLMGHSAKDDDPRYTVEIAGDRTRVFPRVPWRSAPTARLTFRLPWHLLGAMPPAQLAQILREDEPTRPPAAASSHRAEKGQPGGGQPGPGRE